MTSHGTNTCELTVEAAGERLAEVRERVREPISHEGRENDVHWARLLQAQILSEADAGQLRIEWHAARDRLSSSGDSTAKAAERDWQGWVGIAFLNVAGTTELAAEAK